MMVVIPWWICSVMVCFGCWDGRLQSDDDQSCNAGGVKFGSIHYGFIQLIALVLIEGVMWPFSEIWVLHSMCSWYFMAVFMLLAHLLMQPFVF